MRFFKTMLVNFGVVCVIIFLLFLISGPGVIVVVSGQYGWGFLYFITLPLLMSISGAVR